MRRFSPLAVLALAAHLVLLAAAPLGAQQVVGHVPLLPADAGFNPFGLSQVVADPQNADIFVMSDRGLTVLDRAADRFRNIDLGGNPLVRLQSLAFDWGQRRLYVAESDLFNLTGQLIAVDGALRTVLKRVALPFPAGRLAYEGTNQRVFVLESGGSGIAVVDARSLNLTASTTLPTSGTSLAAVDATGRCYVTSIGAGVTYVLDGALNLLSTLPTGASSGEIAVNQNAVPNPRVYVVRGDGNVVVIDAFTEALTTIPVAGAARIALHTVSGYAYVTGASADLTVLDPSNAVTTVPIPNLPAGTGPTAMAIAEASSRLYLAALQPFSTARITVFDVTAGPPTNPRQASTGRTGAIDLAASNVTGQLYVSDGMTHTVSEVDGGANPPFVRQLAVGAALRVGAFNDAAGKGFTLNAASSEAALVDVASPVSATLTPIGDLPLRAAIGGNRFYALNQGSKDITVLDATTGAQLHTTGPLPNDINWDFVFAQNTTTGPKGFLTQLRIDLSNPPTSLASAFNQDAVQSLQPAAVPTDPDTLTGLNATGAACLSPLTVPPCVVGLTLGVCEADQRLYSFGIRLDSIFPTPAASYVVGRFNTDTGARLSALTYANPSAVPSLFPTVLHVDEDCGNSHRVFIPELTAAPPGNRLVMLTDRSPAPATVDIPTAGECFDIAQDATQLFIAERVASVPATGAIQTVDLSALTPAVMDTTTPSGVPSDLFVQPSRNLLFAANQNAQSSLLVYATASTVPTLTLRAELRDLEGPATASFDVGGIPFLLPGRALSGPPTGRITFVDAKHGSVAVINPTPLASDLQIDALALPPTAPGAAYSQQLTYQLSSGTAFALNWEVTSGLLPPGLSLDPVTGVISGTPIAEGTYSFMVRLTDTPGIVPPRADLQDFQITVLALRILTLQLPTAGCNQPYRATFLATGGDPPFAAPPYSWQLVSGPAGATLAADGTFTWTAGPPATCLTVTVRLIDPGGAAALPDLDVCLDVGSIAPPGPVGNALRAVKQVNDVVLSVAPLVLPAGGGLNIYRSLDDPSQLGPRLGPLPSTPTDPYTDSGAVDDPGTYYYQARLLDGCDDEGP